LINHPRQPGVVSPEVLDYVDQLQATLDPFGGKFILQAARWRYSKRETDMEFR